MGSLDTLVQINLSPLQVSSMNPDMLLCLASLTKLRYFLQQNQLAALLTYCGIMIGLSFGIASYVALSMSRWAITRSDGVCDSHSESDIS